MRPGGFDRVQIGIVAFLLATACNSDTTPITAVRPRTPAGPNFDAPAIAAALPSFWAHEVSGQDASGAFYDMLLPASWNGRLVLVVHGLIDPAAPVAPLPRTAAEDSAGAHGYGARHVPVQPRSGSRRGL